MKREELSKKELLGEFVLGIGRVYDLFAIPAFGAKRR